MHIVGGRIANDDEVFAVNRLEGPENLFALALPSGDGVPGSVSGLNGDPVDDEQHDQTRQENPYGTAVDLCLAQVADGLNHDYEHGGCEGRDDRGGEHECHLQKRCTQRVPRRRRWGGRLDRAWRWLRGRGLNFRFHELA